MQADGDSAALEAPSVQELRARSLESALKYKTINEWYKCVSSLDQNTTINLHIGVSIFTQENKYICTSYRSFG